MEQSKQIYIQSKEKITLQSKNALYLKDLVEVYADQEDKNQIENIALQVPYDQGKSSFLVSILSIIEVIKKSFPQYMIFTLGSPEVLVNFERPKKNHDRYLFVRLGVVCFLLFIGSITAIINFHSDVDMGQAHQTIYRIVTGVEKESPLLMQIPYSLGIGAGMSVFFNHILKKRINEEPSPLEVEMYLYQQNMDAYIKGNDMKQDVEEKGLK